MSILINKEYFCKLFELNAHELPHSISEIIESASFEYELLSENEEKELINKINKYILEENLSVCGPQRDNLWERCWREQLDKYYNCDLDLNLLIPKFIYTGNPVRFNQRFIKPCSENFEINYIDVCRVLIFYKYFQDFDNIYEFGCGSAYNLIRISQMFPNAKIFGLDWSASSVELVNSLSKYHKLNIEGLYFNFFKPNYDIVIPDSSIIFTQTALEQIGGEFNKFLDYLLKNAPSLCVHIEPINELYDESNTNDKVACDYIAKRKYLRNYYTEIKRLAKQGKAEIINVKRINSGGLYHESSLLVWKPIR